MRILARLLAAVLFFTLVVEVQVAEAATRPSAPRSVKATPGNGSVKITWRAPASNGGARIDRYAVQQRNSTSAPWVTVKYPSAAARSWTRTGLTNGARYYFRVLAHNRRGNSRPSAAVSARPRTVPTAPRRLEADVYEEELGSFWQIPFSTGGAPVDYYRVEISLDGATWTGGRNVPTAATRLEPEKFTGLTPGERYWLRVRAHNAAGFSVGTSSGPYRAYTVPNPVTELGWVVSSGQVALTWTAPTFTDAEDFPEVPPGVPVATQYRIEKSTDGGATWTTAGTTRNTSYTATGLVNGTEHLLRVSAGTGFANLPFSEPATTTALTPTGPPTVPLNVGYTWDPISQDYVLRWDPPANDGGFDLTRYQVISWQASTPKPYVPTTLGQSATEAPAGGLALSESVSMRACNGPDDGDCGPWSAEKGPIPGGVQDLDAMPSRGETSAVVTLDWDAPATPATVTSYAVSRSPVPALPEDEPVWTVLGTTVDASQEMWVDETAAYETAYRYRVVANGTDGSGAWVTDDVTTVPEHELVVSTSMLEITEEGESASFQVSFDPAADEELVVDIETSNAMVVMPASPTVSVAPGMAATVTIDALDDPNAVSEEVVITLRFGDQEKTVVVTVVDNDA